MPLAVAVLLSTLLLTGHDNGRLVTMPPKTTIIVTLSSNHSTGYRWKLAAPLDRKLLRVVSHRYIRPTGKRPGAAGKEQWVLRTLRAGIARFRLAYVRPWRPHRPARRFGVTVRVT